MSTMMLNYFIFVGVLHLTLGGSDDTLEQLRAAISNVPLDDQVTRAPVSTVSGSVPDWLSGTLIRHACGVLGETSHPDPDMLNRVTQLFDCVSMGQGYSFQNGNVVFSNSFYDTNQVDIWERYEENMNQSSVWWDTVFSERNITAMAKEQENMYKPGKPAFIPNVAWWQLGNDVLATTENTGGYIVDVHNVIAIEDYPYTNGDWLGDGYRGLTNPSHEAYGPDGVVWSTVAAINYGGEGPGKSKVNYAMFVKSDFNSISRDWYTKLILRRRKESLLENTNMVMWTFLFVLFLDRDILIQKPESDICILCRLRRTMSS